MSLLEVNINEKYLKLLTTPNETPTPFFVFAESVGVPKSIYFKWMCQGEIDIKNNKDSFESKLFLYVKKLEYNRICKFTENYISGDKSYQWLLEKIWPDVYNDTKDQVQQYAAYVDKIESNVSKVTLSEDTALANTKYNLNKFDYSLNKGTNYEEKA